MPGFRDRIVHVKLGPNQGGYNLDMAKEVFDEIAIKGQLAAQMLDARFNPESGTDPKTGRSVKLTWDNHRWTRYRTFMASLEDLAIQFRDRWESEANADAELQHSGKPLNALIADSRNRTVDDGYPWHGIEQFERATKFTDDFVAVARSWREHGDLFDLADQKPGRSPRPKSRLRVTPPDDAVPPPRPMVSRSN